VKDKWTKRAGDFRTIISAVHKPTGTTFHTDGNRVAVIAEGFRDEINTADYQNGGNTVKTIAQLRAVAADWLNQQERGER
jgi:hypothetical protein